MLLNVTIAFTFVSSILFFNTLAVYFTNKAIFDFKVKELFFPLLTLIGIAGISLTFSLSYLSELSVFFLEIYQKILLTYIVIFLLNGQFYPSLKFEKKIVQIKNKYVAEISESALLLMFLLIEFVCIFYLISWLFFYQKIYALLLVVNGLFFINLINFSKNKNSNNGGFFDATAFNVFSKNKKNVIVFVSDSFSNEALKLILDHNLYLKDKLQGFTFYQNTTSSYSSTNLSVPSMLTGVTYQSGESVLEYYKRAFLSETSIPFVLKNNGFDSEALTACPAVLYKNKDVFSNYVDSGSHRLSLKIFLELIDFGVIRSLPAFMKNFLIKNNKFKLSKLVKFIAEEKYDLNFDTGEIFFKNNISNYLKSSVTNNSKFKFIHLGGAHPPFKIDKNYFFTDHDLVEQDIEAYYRQAKYCLIEFIFFVEKLREQDLLQNSLIIFLGDHGFLTREAKRWESRVSVNAQQLGTPALLVYDPQENINQFLTSEAPIELKSIPNLVFNFSLKNNTCGFERADKYSDRQPLLPSREFSYLLQSPTWETDFTPAQMVNFTVKGHASSLTSWREISINNPIPLDYFPLNSFISCNNFRAMSFEKKLNYQGAVATSKEWFPVHKEIALFFKTHHVNSKRFIFYFYFENTYFESLNIIININDVIHYVNLESGLQWVPLDFMAEKTLDFVILINPNQFEHVEYNYSVLSFIRFYGFLLSHEMFQDGSIENSFLPQQYKNYYNKINFSTDTNANNWLVAGWTESQDDFPWAISKLPTLKVPIADSSANEFYRLSVKLNAHESFYKVGGLNVLLEINSEVGISVNLQAMDYYRLILSGRVIKNGFLFIRFLIKSQPFESNFYFFQLFELDVTVVPVVRANSPILFSSKNRNYLYLTSGWQEPASDFVWSSDVISTLTFPLHVEFVLCDWIRFCVTLAPDTRDIDAQLISVYYGDMFLINWHINCLNEYVVYIPRKLINNNLLHISFHILFPKYVQKEAKFGYRLGLGVQMLEATISIVEPVQMNTLINFGMNLPSMNYLSVGWGEPGVNHVWSIGHSSHLLLPISDSLEVGGWIAIKFYICNPLVATDIHKFQRLVLKINTIKLLDIDIFASSSFCLIVPRNIWQNNLLKIDFDFPNSISLNALGYGSDKQLRAIQLHSIEPTTEESVFFDQIISFGIAQRSSPYLSYGWKTPEAEWVWSSGFSSYLTIPLAETFDYEYLIDISLWLAPLIFKDVVSVQRVDISINNLIITRLHLTNSGTYVISVPSSLLINNCLYVRLTYLDACSLHDLGVSEDHTILSMQLYTAAISKR
jgi:hypothetical protein